MVLSQLSDPPSQGILESLYKKQVSSARSMKDMIALSDQQIALGKEKKSYERLYRLVEAQVGTSGQREASPFHVEKQSH